MKYLFVLCLVLSLGLTGVLAGDGIEGSSASHREGVRTGDGNSTSRQKRLTITINLKKVREANLKKATKKRRRRELEQQRAALQNRTTVTIVVVPSEENGIPNSDPDPDYFPPSDGDAMDVAHPADQMNVEGRQAGGLYRVQPVPQKKPFKWTDAAIDRLRGCIEALNPTRDQYTSVEFGKAIAQLMQQTYPGITEQKIMNKINKMLSNDGEQLWPSVFYTLKNNRQEVTVYFAAHMNNIKELFGIYFTNIGHFTEKLGYSRKHGPKRLKVYKENDPHPKFKPGKNELQVKTELQKLNETLYYIAFVKKATSNTPKVDEVSAHLRSRGYLGVTSSFYRKYNFDLLSMLLNLVTVRTDASLDEMVDQACRRFDLPAVDRLEEGSVKAERKWARFSSREHQSIEAWVSENVGLMLEDKQMALSELSTYLHQQGLSPVLRTEIVLGYYMLKHNLNPIYELKLRDIISGEDEYAAEALERARAKMNVILSAYFPGVGEVQFSGSKEDNCSLKFLRQGMIEPKICLNQVYGLIGEHYVKCFHKKIANLAKMIVKKRGINGRSYKIRGSAFNTEHLLNRHGLDEETLRANVNEDLSNGIIDFRGAAAQVKYILNDMPPVYPPVDEAMEL